MWLAMAPSHARRSCNCKAGRASPADNAPTTPPKEPIHGRPNSPTAIIECGCVGTRTLPQRVGRRHGGDHAYSRHVASASFATSSSYTTRIRLAIGPRR
ncbi:hypothetical protein K6L27_38935, partial [Burkholderia cenocepacia]|uniref:hypothetical protein n=1 Tax=Burkholderia cenocepacia TaxID=95486 RepID=UPI00222FFAD5